MQDFEMRMQIPADDKGFIDRECPNEACLFGFKVDLHDWEAIEARGHAHCPRCGLDDTPDRWYTTYQSKVIEENVGNYVLAQLSNDLDRFFSDFARQFRSNKVMSVTYRPDSSNEYIAIPFEQSEAWETEITCSDCGTRFSVIGNAYFCPCCGKDLSTDTVSEVLASYRKRIESLDGLRSYFETIGTREEAERQVTSLREDTLGAIVGAYEAYAKMRYAELGGTNARRGVFQRLREGEGLFTAITGETYADYTSVDDVNFMFLMFQKRHLLTHSNGLVDQPYIDKTGDPTYSVGQRIVLGNAELLRFLSITDAVVNGLAKASPNP